MLDNPYVYISNNQFFYSVARRDDKNAPFFSRSFEYGIAPIAGELILEWVREVQAHTR